MQSFFRWLGRLINPPDFEIEVRDGNVRLLSGKVTSEFLNECQDICRNDGILSGGILGREGGGRLEFYGEIPVPSRQRFLNVWNHVGRL